MAGYRVVRDNELYHYGVKGMKWGVRRFQNKDGSYTRAGRKRYSKHSINLKSEDIYDAVDKIRIGLVEPTESDKRLITEEKVYSAINPHWFRFNDEIYKKCGDYRTHPKGENMKKLSKEFKQITNDLKIKNNIAGKEKNSRT